MPTKSTFNFFVVLQVMGIFQMLYGLMILNAWMTSPESMIYDSLRDDHLQKAVRSWHEKNKRAAINSMVAWGAGVLVLSSGGYFYARRVNGSKK